MSPSFAEAQAVLVAPDAADEAALRLPSRT